MKVILYILLVFCLGMLLPPAKIQAVDMPVQLTQSEQDWLEQKYTVRVRVGNWPPFMFSEGGFRGIAVDYIKKIFVLHGIQYEFISDETIPWNKALDALGKHQTIDLLLTAKISEERKKTMLFTDEYLFLPWVVFSRMDSPFIAGLDDLAGKSVCVPQGYAIQEMLAKDYPQIRLEPITGPNLEPRCLERLAMGRGDAYVGNLAVGSYIIQTQGYNNLKVAAPTSFGPHNQAMAVRDDWPQLVGIINKTLKSFTPEEHAEIRNHWLSVRYEYGIRPWDVIKWVVGILCVAAVLVSVILFWNRRLQREIDERLKVEKLLKESEEKYRSLSDAASEGILIAAAGKIIEVNRAVVEMFGATSVSDLLEMRVSDCFVPESREMIRTAIETESDSPYEVAALKKDGRSFPVEVCGKMFTYRGKRVRVTTIRDLSAQRHAEDEIRRLQGIIPICMYCKEIRDDRGLWKQLEEYISEHSEATFSHGVCEKCMKKYHPDIS